MTDELEQLISEKARQVVEREGLKACRDYLVRLEHFTSELRWDLMLQHIAAVTAQKARSHDD